MKPDSQVLEELFATIAERKGADPSTSYTAKLFARGRGKIAQKVGEEAVETVIAAMRSDPDEVISESADLFYHLLVLWADCNVAPEQVWAELRRRAGTSGIAEKKARSKS